MVPGTGLAVARLGQTLRDIEAAAGPGVVVGPRCAVWEAGVPAFSAYFDAEGTCDLIEVHAPDGTGEGVTLGGVQVLGRPMADVVEDLERHGLRGQRTSLTVEYGEGFTLWSLGDLETHHGAAGPERDMVVDGVAIGSVDRCAEPSLV